MIAPGGRSLDVLLCTFRRPHVGATLASLDRQILPPDVRLRILVADNDVAPTGRDVVAAAAAGMRRPVVYLHAPARNIAVARNALLAASAADLVAFIDDDEIAAPDWLAQLLAALAASGADAVFGPTRAVYGPGAPDWMRRQEVHANRPARRRGIVETGHTCNALLRWRGTPWRDARFDEAFGRSGGEDTEFFFRLRGRGARFELAEAALVFEAVPPERASFAWLRARRFGMGRSYARCARPLPARLGLLAASTAKAAVCVAAALAPRRGATRRAWLLRATLHAGICAGCLAAGPGPARYGG